MSDELIDLSAYRLMVRDVLLALVSMALGAAIAALGFWLGLNQ